MKEFSTEEMTIIRSYEEELDQDSTVFPLDLLNMIYNRKLFKLFVPNNVNGRMSSLEDSARIFEEASYINGSFGWLITIGAGGGFFAGFMNEKLLEEVYSPLQSVIAGSGAPTGIAERCEGGYRVTGEWAYCSGADYATSFTANAMIGEQKQVGSGEIRSFTFTPDQVQIIRDWNAFGLKATGSHSIKVKNAFVPEYRTFSIFERNDVTPDPVYTFPFLPFAQASFTAVVLGLGKRLIEEAEQYMENLEDGVTKKKKLTHALEMNLDKFQQVKQRFYDSVQSTWSLHLSEQITEETADDLSTICVQTTQDIRSIAYDLYPFLGMFAMKQDSAFNRVWRDFHTASQHSLLAPYTIE